MVASRRMILPDFIIIGSMKSGTTSLYRSLSGHPEIGMSRDKETDFFITEGNFGRGLQWYSGQFEPGFRFYGEASTNYTKAGVFKGVPERIKAHVPNVRLIYVVRDPVDRFASQYRHSWTIGDISAKPEMLPDTPEYEHILDVSSYARQLEVYLEQFDLDDILVVDFDRLIRDETAVLNKIYDFIGASPLADASVGQFNDHAEISRVPNLALRFAQSPAGRAFSLVVDRERRDQIRRLLAFGKPRRPPGIPEDLLERIRDDIRPDIEAFRRMTGKRLSGWSV